MYLFSSALYIVCEFKKTCCSIVWYILLNQTYCSTCKGSGLTRKYQTRLERPAKDKHSSLFSQFVSYKEKKFYDTGFLFILVCLTQQQNLFTIWGTQKEWLNTFKNSCTDLSWTICNIPLHLIIKDVYSLCNGTAHLLKCHWLCSCQWKFILRLRWSVVPLCYLCLPF